MSIFKKITGLFSSSGRSEQNIYGLAVRCKRCGEIICARINLNNDLSAEYDGEQTFYVCRKLLVGENRCFQQIEVVLKFDENRRVMDQAIIGGDFVEGEPQD